MEISLCGFFYLRFYNMVTQIRANFSNSMRIVSHLDRLAKRYGFKCALEEVLTLKRAWDAQQRNGYSFPFEIKIGLAEIAFTQKNYESCHSLCDDMLKQDVDIDQFMRLVSLKAQSFMSEKKYEDAEAIIDDAMKRDYVSDEVFAIKFSLTTRSKKDDELAKWASDLFMKKPGKQSAVIHSTILFALKKFDEIKDVINPYLSNAFGRKNPDGSDVKIIALFIAMKDIDTNSFWMGSRHAQEGLRNKEDISDSLFAEVKKLKLIHTSKPTSEEYDLLYRGGEQASVSGRIIREYNGFGHIFEAMHAMRAGTREAGKLTGVSGSRPALNEGGSSAPRRVGAGGYMVTGYN